MEFLTGIETAPLDELMLIRAEQARVKERLARMAELREEVSQVVFARVDGDYREQASALAERARPIEAAVRAEYAKLASQIERLSGDLAAARLEREEGEFRRKLGEYDEATFTALGARAADKLAACERAVEGAEKLRGRFLAAFSSEAELRQASAAPAPADIATPIAPAPPVAPVPPVAEPAAAASDEHDGKTRPYSTGNFVVPAAAKLESTPEEGTVMLPPRDALPATQILQRAKLVAVGIDAKLEFFLGPANTVGRTTENQVRIPLPAISRKHARLDLAADGLFHLVDLQSENGCFVNGERVRERALKDGDIVQFATERFRFTAG